MFALYTIFVASLLAASTFAAPSVPQLQGRVDVNATGDNGSCAKLFGSCVSSVEQAHVFFENPFGYNNQCTLAAVCYDANVDDFLSAVFEGVPHGSRDMPYSNTSARLPNKVYNRIAHTQPEKRDLQTRATAEQQNFVDYYFSTMSDLGGPYPTHDYVVALWADIAAWTGHCAGARAIPYTNLGDWFQYSAASNYFPVCGGVATASESVSTVTVLPTTPTLTSVPIVTTLISILTNLPTTPSLTPMPASQSTTVTSSSTSTVTVLPTTPSLTVGSVSTTVTSSSTSTVTPSVSSLTVLPTTPSLTIVSVSTSSSTSTVIPSIFTTLTNLPTTPTLIAARTALIV